MTSKHTKAGRRARRRAHHTALARAAWGAYQGRRLRAMLDREAPPGFHDGAMFHHGEKIMSVRVAYPAAWFIARAAGGAP